MAEEKKKGERKGGKYFKRENTFMLRRRITEKEREENIKEKENIFFAEKNKNRKGKGEKYLEMENIFLVMEQKKEKEGNIKRRKIYYLRRRGKRSRKRRKIFGE